MRIKKLGQDCAGLRIIFKAHQWLQTFPYVAFDTMPQMDPKTGKIGQFF
jgi:hypothetical protein